MSNYLLNRRAVMLGLVPKAPPKEKKPIAQVSENKKAELKEEKPQRDELQEWFKSRIAEFKGECLECQAYINKSKFEFAVMSAAHVLAKRDTQFPSVATHPANCLELCVDCHTKYDKGWESAARMKIWPLAIDKFLLIYPSIAPKERKHIPELLRQEIAPKVIVASLDKELDTVIIEKG